jgi:hypothetical protein
MRKSLLIASLAVISMNVLGIGDHPLINRDQNRIQQNLTPVSNAQTTPDRGFNPIQEISDDEESNFETTQGQISSGSRKRSARDEFTDFMNKSIDKRRKIVTLQDTISQVRAFPNREMSNEEKVQLAEQIISVAVEMDDLHFYCKGLQSRQEVGVCKKFVACLSKTLGYKETEDYSTLFDYVENLKTKLSESEENSQEALQRIDELNQELNTQRAKISELNQQSKSSEEEISRQKEEIDSSKRAYQKLLGENNQLKENFQEVLERKEHYKGKTKSLETKQKDLNDENIELNKLLAEKETEQKNLIKKLLAEREKELKISEYEKELYKKRTDFLSKGCCRLTYELDLKYRNNGQLISEEEKESRRKVYSNLQELQGIEWHITKLFLTEKNLTDFLNMVIYYKRGWPIYTILSELSKGNVNSISMDTAREVHDELEKQNIQMKQDFKKELDKLFQKKGIGDEKKSYIDEYKEQHKIIQEELRSREIGRYNPDYYNKIFKRIGNATKNAEQITKELKNSIDKKMAIVRSIREEKIIQYFVEKIEPIPYFRLLMYYVDRSLAGYYEAILKMDMSISKNK